MAKVFTPEEREEVKARIVERLTVEIFIPGHWTGNINTHPHAITS